jgi:hypothetical protein
MGAKKKAVAAGAAAKAAKENAYVQRLVEDDDLRDDIRDAYESLKDAYERLGKGKSPAKALLDDKKLQKDLRNAADSIRDAGSALRDAPNSKGGGFMRKLMLLTVAGGLALALSEGLRKKVLDALFGAEEEFEYTATTTPAASNGTSTTSSTSSTTAGSKS